MPVDDEKVKDALDDFEDDKFSDAKEKLAGEIKKVRDEFLKSKLKLQKDLEGKPEEEEEDSKDDAEGEDEDSKEKDQDQDDADDDKQKRKKRVSKAIKKKIDKEE